MKETLIDTLRIVFLVKDGMHVCLYTSLHEVHHHVLLALELGVLSIDVDGIGQGIYNIRVGL